ncbi:MAG: hypothetical protein PHV34_22230 [Verrucomicrobiae bacterium]|nr:hypothetical protein [Verrucomicrobiae bacterium]
MKELSSRLQPSGHSGIRMGGMENHPSGIPGLAAARKAGFTSKLFAASISPDRASGLALKTKLAVNITIHFRVIFPSCFILKTINFAKVFNIFLFTLIRIS